MSHTEQTLIRLVGAILFPVLLTVLFYLAEKRTRFGSLNYKVKQAVIGVGFGISAILATEFGIPVDGAVMNVRNASPLTAGLIFGWPAGILSGLIGGIERWFSHAGDFTRLACTLGTIISGLLGASVRKFLMDNKKASWLYGLFVGVVSEVLHMLMVFLSNFTDIRRAFDIVQIVAIPMIVSNGLSVMLSIITVSLLSGRTGIKLRGKENISQTFQRWLLLCVLLAFMVTSVFTYIFQTHIALASADEILKTNINDVKNDINDASDRNLLELTLGIASRLPDNADADDLKRLAAEFDVSEINIIGEDGFIAVSTDETIVGFDMAQGVQSSEFLVLLDGTETVVQEYGPISLSHSIYRKYAGTAIDEGFLQVGYDASYFQRQIGEQVRYAAENRHVGQTGSIIICDENGVIVSDRDGHEGEHVSIFGDSSALETSAGVRFTADIYGERSYMMYTNAEGYYIIGVIPEGEALFSRDTAVYMLAFMEVIVFSALFVFVFVLIKKLVVQNIDKINESLGLITGGNLEVKVNVRDNKEFASLSDDINSTVSTLKHYISEAAARIDRELEFAKQIQCSALPSVFPPYPNRTDFEIYALMDPAKEVGGDFYDFFLLGEDRLVFLVADVSGKGIPAAMFMMTAKVMMKGLAESGLEVDEVMSRTNEKLCEGNEAGMFVTSWMGILDLKTGLLSYANAGHNPPVVRRRNKSYEYLKTRANFILAGMEGARYKKQELQLEQGDEIFLYTDGVTEAQDSSSELFGEERLLISLNEKKGISVEELCKKVKSDVDGFVGQADQFDDITMVSVRWGNDDGLPSLTVKPALESLGRVMEFIEGEMEKAEVPLKTANKLLIAFDEAYSNVIHYSGAQQAEISCGTKDDVLILRICDDGVRYDPFEAEDPDTTLSAEDRNIGGLGVFMIKKMMDSLEYAYEDGHNLLTMKMKLTK